MNMTPEQKIQRACIALIREQPFYATAILKQEIKACAAIPTAATNGKELLYNPEFVAKHAHDSIVTLLIHEAEHVLFGHHIRMGGRDHKMWNVATDLAINSHLKDRAGFKELDGLVPGEKPFTSMPLGENAEWYYDNAKPDGGCGGGKKPPPKGKGNDEGQGGGKGQPQGDEQKDGDGDGKGQGKGDDKDKDKSQSQQPGEGGGQGGAPDASPDPAGYDRVHGEVMPSPLPEQQAEAERQQLVIQCAAGCPPGKMPGHMKALVDSVTKPVKVPWHIMLRRFCERTARTRLTYNRINRRLNDWPDRIPARGGKTLGEICVVLDTSGSHWSRAPEILDHIEAIVKAYPKTSVRLIQFDTDAVEKVYHHSDLPLDRNRWQMSGGGGTQLTPAWKLAQKSGATAIVVFTDGYLDDWPKQRSAIPVIWLMSTDVKPPCQGMVVEVAS